MVPELLYKNVPESLYVENMGTMLSMVAWCIPNFSTLIFQYDEKCKKRVWPNVTTETLCKGSSYTMTWCEEKTELNRAWRFLRTNKNSLKYPLLGVQCIKFVCFVFRARLNEREAPGKVVTVRLPKRLTQMNSVSHTLLSTLHKHWSTSS